MEAKEISRAVISRLPIYYRYLGQLVDEDVERVSSKELSEIMKSSASQIRQDLNCFGGFGQQGYGYNVKYLYEEIGKILGLDKKHNLILVGAGNLGQALANYVNFARRGFIIRGIFDQNEKLYGRKIRDVEIRPMNELSDFVIKNDIDIAVLTIPKESAITVAKELSQCGIKGIWNFAHVDLDVPEGIVVENVHLSESLMKLSYDLNNLNLNK